MSLDKQIIPLPMDKGLDTKTDPKQEEPGFLRKVVNIVYETVKLFRKRNGYDLVNLLDLDNNPIVGANTLSKYKDELVLFTDTKLYSYASAMQRFISKGSIYAVNSESRITFKNASSQSRISGLVVDNFLVSAWVDASTGVRYSVQDLTNQSFLVSNGVISATGDNVTVCSIDNTAFIVYTDGANITYKRFSILQPTTLWTPGLPIATNVDTTNLVLDSENCLDKVFIAYNSTSVGAKVALFSIDSADNLSSILNITGSDGSSAITVSCDEDHRILLGYSDGVDLKLTIYSYTLSTPLLIPTVIETVADVVNCTFIDNGSEYDVYYEVQGASADRNYVKHTTVDLSGTVASPTVFIRGMGLASKAFYNGDTQLVALVHGSNLQSTYFVVDSAGVVATKFANQNGGGLLTWGALPTATLYGDSQFILTGPFRNRLKSDNGTFFSTNGVAYAVINFAPTVKFRNTQLADALHICSGLLKMYDGNVVVEHGFNFYPEGLTNPSNSTTGGNLSDGSYGYVAVYRWADNTGKDHQSAPSPQTLTVTLSGGTSTQRPTIRVPTLRLTEKTSVVIDLYRTEDAGTIFYKVTDDLNPTYNDTTVDYVDIQDTIADGVALISREPIYTTGGVLENVPAPGSSFVAVMKNRIAVLGENSSRVYFSKEIGEGRPVEFSDQIYRDIDPSGGPASALQSMDEKIIVFTNDALFNIAGDGPTNTGEQDTFIQPELISSDIGCTEPSSLVLTPNGIMFKSRKGIWQLGRGLDLTYVGDRVEAYNNTPITSATVVGKFNQIRFTTSTPDALVYNYHLDRWGTFDNHGALSAVAIRDQYYYLRTDSELYIENASSFSDASSAINMKFETGWLTLSELQGYQRVYHLLVLGSYKSAHLMRIKIAYDFVDAWVQEEVVNPADFVNTSTYGEDSPYGSGTPYGGSATPYQVRINLERQKCTAIKISVEDAQNSTGEGLSISAITFRAGLKQGTAKLGATQKVGSVQ